MVYFIDFKMVSLKIMKSVWNIFFPILTVIIFEYLVTLTKQSISGPKKTLIQNWEYMYMFLNILFDFELFEKELSFN